MPCSKKIKAVPIRPHHGMCLAFFQGNGYSEGFTKHMGEMLALFETDIPVRLTVAADEICSACPNNRDGVCESGGLAGTYDRAVLEHCGLSEGQELGYREFARLVEEKILIPGLRRKICGNCQWDGLCGGGCEAEA